MTSENTGGLTDYGSFIALALLIVLATLLIPLCRSKLKIRAFLAASVTLGFLIVFFWLWPTITEISIAKFGSIKTNVEQAKTYLNQMKEIQSQVKDVKEKIEQDAQAASQLQAETTKLRADVEQARLERQPRHITPEQQENITNAIRSFSGQKYLLFVAPGGEPNAFICEINSSLVAAGWQMATSTEKPLFSVTVNTACGDVGVVSLSGVHIRVAVNYDPKTGDAANALGNALIHENIVTAGERDPKNVPDSTTVLLMVGVKP